MGALSELGKDWAFPPLIESLEAAGPGRRRDLGPLSLLFSFQGVLERGSAEGRS